jgi:hypothetical protein
MGCDYYIYKNLVIYYNDTWRPSNITLSRDSGYFYYPDIDEDDPDYEKIINKSTNDQLKSSMKDIIIYENNSFLIPNYELKYKYKIENELKNDKKEWKDIIKIVKSENRYERD